MDKFVMLEDGTIVNTKNISHIYFHKRGAPFDSSYCMSLIKNGEYQTEFDITERDYKNLVNKLVTNNNNSNTNRYE